VDEVNSNFTFQLSVSKRRREIFYSGASAGTITLANDSEDYGGFTYRIWQIAAGAVTVDVEVGGTINGAASGAPILTTGAQYQAIDLVSRGPGEYFGHLS
jgi:uncharacterized protein affecting Mg2+/Co2+ transport